MSSSPVSIKNEKNPLSLANRDFLACFSHKLRLFSLFDIYFNWKHYFNFLNVFYVAGCAFKTFPP